MFSRPKPGETEEDLLQFQKQFLNSQSSPAAAVVRAADKRKVEPPDKQKDVVSLGDLPTQFNHTTPAEHVPPIKKTKKTLDERRAEDDLLDGEELLDKHDTHMTRVLANIVERDMTQVPVYYPSVMADAGFPAAMHRGPDLPQPPSSTKKKSIFAQQFAGKSLKDYGVKSNAKKVCVNPDVCVNRDVVMDPAMKSPTVNTWVDKPACKSSPQQFSSVVTGAGLSRPDSGSQSRDSNEASRIHQENQAKLQSMSAGEIHAERAKLIETLDPDLVKFLKTRRQKQCTDASGGQNSDTRQTDTSHSRISGCHSEQKMDTREPEVTTTNIHHKKISPNEKAKIRHNVSDENEKLKWTGELPPPPKSDLAGQVGFPARFDLTGSLVAVDAALPTHLGLHHHGKEPERAGYTLEELFMLSRSANMSQRSTALLTLAHIIRNAREGRLAGVVSTPLIPALLEAGLLFILRWALDDSTESSMQAAVTALHATIVCAHDELAADSVSSWPAGCDLPAMCIPREEEVEENSEDAAAETDAVMLKRDIIAGLLRMDLLSRIRYILEVCRPPAQTTVYCLEILIRMARHSAQTAYQIVQCPRLVDVLFSEFLPSTWSPASDSGAPLSCVHGLPLPPALKLLRVICSAGRHMAANLNSKYDLLSRVARYLAVEGKDLGLTPGSAADLQLESLRLWLVLTKYGLSTSAFTHLHPIINTRLQTAVKQAGSSDVEFSACLLALLSSTVSVAAAATTHSLQQHRHTNQPHTTQTIPELNWSHVSGLLSPVTQIFERCLQTFMETYTANPTDCDLRLLSASTEFISCYYSHISSQPGYDVVATLSDMERLCTQQIVPCIKSIAWKRAVTVLREQSLLLHGTSDSSKVNRTRSEVASNLPELGALLGDKASYCQFLGPHGSLRLILSIVELLLRVGSLHRDLAGQYYSLVLADTDILLYVRRCCQPYTALSANSALARLENRLHHSLIRMSRHVKVSCDSTLYHRSALFLLARLQQGDEYMAHDILSTVIFNKDLASCQAAPQDVDLETLSMTPQTVSSAAAGVAVERNELLQNVADRMPAIRNTYLQVVAGLQEKLEKSRCRSLGPPDSVDSLLSGVIGQLLVPQDWPFLPLLSLYSRSSSQANMTPLLESMATHTLCWLYYLETVRPEVLSAVSTATKYSRLMCIFLTGSDLFLDRWIHAYMVELFKLYIKPGATRSLDFTVPVPGLPSFYDMYTSLLGQYDAVSFGDSLFGCFVLLPMQQRHAVSLRRAVWGEHQTVLLALIIPIKEVLLPVSSFLEPEEQDVNLLRLYMQALLSGRVTLTRTPLPYLIAVHHLNRFMFTRHHTHAKMRQAMLQRVAALQDKPAQSNKLLSHHLLLYCRYDEEVCGGLQMYDSLPQTRQETLTDAQTNTQQ